MPHKDRETRLEYLKSYHKTHYGKAERRQIAEYDKKYYAENKEREKIRHQKWYVKNREVVRQKILISGKKLKYEVMCHYSEGIPKCKGCRYDDIRALTIDHIIPINGDKNRIDGLGKRLYRYLKKRNYPSGYQVLCFNCNYVKLLEFRGHKKEDYHA